MSRPQRRLTKLSTNDIKVLQALRAGPMDPSELYERFSGAYAMSNVLSNGYVTFEKGIYRITESGRAICPTRRQVEMAKNLPPLPIQPVRQVKQVETISIYNVPTIKPVESDIQMKTVEKTSKAKLIREIITVNPGINHDDLVARVTNNTTDFAEAKKATDMIEYVVRNGGFTRCNDLQLPGESKSSAKRYYTEADYLKRKEKAQKVIETTVPTLEQHHEAAAAVIKLSDIRAEHGPSFKQLIEENTKSALEVQEGGDHYKRMKIQPIEYITANNLSFIEGSIVKYISRRKNKNGIQDLKKARHFIDIPIEQESAA
jgi:hypothetical protein